MAGPFLFRLVVISVHGDKIFRPASQSDELFSRLMSICKQTQGDKCISAKSNMRVNFWPFVNLRSSPSSRQMDSVLLSW